MKTLSLRRWRSQDCSRTGKKKRESEENTRARKSERERRGETRERLLNVRRTVWAPPRVGEPVLPMIHTVGEPVVRGRVFTLT